MGMEQKNKQSKLSVFKAEDDLAFMKRNRDKFVKKMGQDTYERLVKELEDHISSRKQPRSATPSEV
jgi:hypothetical protein